MSSYCLGDPMKTESTILDQSLKNSHFWIIAKLKFVHTIELHMGANFPLAITLARIDIFGEVKSWG